MRRRGFFGLCAAALLALSLPSASYAADETLNVGIDTAFMPFEFTHDGKLQGFDVDLWTTIAKNLGLKFKWHTMDFDGLIPALQTRNVDVVLAGMTIKPSRAEVIDFSIPYYSSGLAVVVSDKETSIKSPADLAGKTIGVKTGTTSVDYVRKNFPTAKTLSFPNIDGAFLALQAGRVDGVLFDTPVVAYYAATAGKGTSRLLKPSLTSGEFYGIGFVKGSPLVGKVNDELRKMAADGTYAKLYEHWFGAEPDFLPK